MGQQIDTLNNPEGFRWPEACQHNYITKAQCPLSCPSVRADEHVLDSVIVQIGPKNRPECFTEVFKYQAQPLSRRFFNHNTALALQV